MSSTDSGFSGAHVQFLKKLPVKKKLSENLEFSPEKYALIYDKKLEAESVFRKWRESFELTYAVSGGEKLKDLDYFSGHVKKIMRVVGSASPKNMAVLAVGGGSVGDFAGFFASVYKRGVPLVHMPSTLLSSLDSAHGGKTALNVGDFKNQIGTFYPASSVLIIKELLESLPETQILAATGELAKIALISGGELFAKMKDTSIKTFDDVWEHLPAAINAKYEVVKKDPFEKTGERIVLNLGHTLGHAFELYYGLPHGVAIGLGLVFSAHWSHHHGYLDFQELELITAYLHERFGVQRAHQFFAKKRRMSRGRLRRLIAEDKKLTSQEHLSFVFLAGIGRPLVKVVTLESVLTEAQRQGWIAG